VADPRLWQALLIGEIESLEPFAFVAVSPAGQPLQLVEVTRREDGGLEVRVPGRPPFLPELPVPVRSALRERGFASEDPADRARPWVREAEDAKSAVEIVRGVLADTFGAAPDIPLDVAHGSHRAEHEARLKLAAVRERVEKVLRELTGRTPEQDADGDYLVPIHDVRVIVAPRMGPLGVVVVRVFAITNVGVAVTPELGLVLARLNFGQMFGRFALDAENRSIWVDETLLGDHFGDEELKFTVNVVAGIANEWDERLKQMFGGATYPEALARRADQPGPPAKPGQGGYL
jgi:hypothetical protein